MYNGDSMRYKNKKNKNVFEDKMSFSDFIAKYKVVIFLFIILIIFIIALIYILSKPVNKVNYEELRTNRDNKEISVNLNDLLLDYGSCDLDPNGGNDASSVTYNVHAEDVMVGKDKDAYYEHEFEDNLTIVDDSQYNDPRAAEIHDDTDSTTSTTTQSTSETTTMTNDPTFEEKDYPETDNNRKKFRITLENITNNIKIKITNNNNSDAKEITYEDTDNGKYEYYIDDIYHIITYTVSIYDANSECNDTLYRSFEVTLPKYNTYYTLTRCENNNSDVCSQEYTYTDYTQDEFEEATKDYVADIKTNDETSENNTNKKIIILIIVIILVILIIIIAVIIKNKSNGKHKHFILVLIILFSLSISSNINALTFGIDCGFNGVYHPEVFTDGGKMLYCVDPGLAAHSGTQIYYNSTVKHNELLNYLMSHYGNNTSCTYYNAIKFASMTQGYGHSSNGLSISSKSNELINNAQSAINKAKDKITKINQAITSRENKTISSSIK